MSLEQHNDADKKEVSEQKNAAQYEAAIKLSIDAIISNAIQNDSDIQRYAGRIHG